MLGLNITTSAQTREVEVRGPGYDEVNDFITWGIWLPYEEIYRAGEDLGPFLRYYFDALVIVFAEYGVEAEAVRKVQTIAQQEILGNPEYVQKEQKRTKIDLSDIPF